MFKERKYTILFYVLFFFLFLKQSVFQLYFLVCTFSVDTHNRGLEKERETEIVKRRRAIFSNALSDWIRFI